MLPGAAVAGENRIAWTARRPLFGPIIGSGATSAESSSPPVTVIVAATAIVRGGSHMFGSHAMNSSGTSTSTSPAFASAATANDCLKVTVPSSQ